MALRPLGTVLEAIRQALVETDQKRVAARPCPMPIDTPSAMPMCRWQVSMDYRLDHPADKRLVSVRSNVRWNVRSNVRRNVRCVADRCR